jgi:hypothetical protein
LRGSSVQIAFGEIFSGRLQRYCWSKSRWGTVE